MKKIYSRAISMLAAIAMVCTVITTISVPVQAESSLPLTVEAEACTLGSGVTVATDVYGTKYPGYSGAGFAWVTNAGPITLKVNVPENAMYELKTRCWMYLGAIDETRLQSVSVNGKKIGDFYIPNKGQWIDYSFGFFYLEKGTATIEIGSSGSWGYIIYDTITFDYADMPDLNIEPTLCDPKATAETKSLMKYLTSVYGKSVISGQQEIYGSGHDGNYEYEFDYIYNKTGKYPAIRGFDFMNYNPLYGWEDGTTDRIIEWVKERGGIATACWHINIPQDFTSYKLGEAVDWQKCTYKPTSSFKTANCLDSSTKEYAYLMAAIDDLAEQLLILQEANVPVILRPFHEAEGYNNIDGSGAWFWWGSSGAEAFKGLWKLLYNTLTEKYGLHNLIWEVNLYTYANSLQWYPGDNYVDIVAYDKYEGSPTNWGTSAATSLFLSLVNYTNDTKMVAMSENDVIPDIKNIINEGAWWLYFCPWYSEYLIDRNDPVLLKTIYNSDKVITLDELPEDLYNFVVPSTRLIGDVNLDGNFDAIDFGLLKSYLLGVNTVSIDLTNADVDGSGNIDALDFALMKQKLLGIIDKFPADK
ncbi:glycoside hydrolase [Ruminiclostridium herbifermentans]|uniref:cellulase n=1 Tax=Ruminiclostridium herbifermentans TaxID=2488810 RepID=A0A4U7JKK5_9FIRM|nr:glycosyl hydrolase [Ruminiclostridium herbifermentans]QNU68648.1 glycoside hydrolase [Ruminiclostridium herbifermentans]